VITPLSEIAILPPEGHSPGCQGLPRPGPDDAAPMIGSSIPQNVPTPMLKALLFHVHSALCRISISSTPRSCIACRAP